VLSSRFTVDVRMRGEAAERLGDELGARPVLRYTGTIDHGPYLGAADRAFGLARIRGRMRLGPELRAALADRPALLLPVDGAFLRIRGTVAFDDTARMRYSSPAFEGPVARASDGDQRLHLSWQGLEGRTEVTAPGGRLESVRGDFRLPGLSLEVRGDGDPTALHLAGMHLEGKIRPRPEGVLWTGEETLRIDEVRLRAEEGRLHLGSLRLADSLSVADGKARWSLAIASERIRLPGAGEDRRPGLRAAELRMELGGIRTATLERMGRMSREAADLSPEAIKAQSRAILRELLQGEPVLRLRRLHLATTAGDVDLDGRLRWKGGDLSGVAGKRALLRSLEARLALAAPRALLARLAARGLEERADLAPEKALERARKRIGSLIASGLLEERGDRLATEAVLEEGRLRVNGRAIPLGASL
jgi:hypothetical protein